MNGRILTVIDTKSRLTEICLDTARNNCRRGEIENNVISLSRMILCRRFTGRS